MEGGGGAGRRARGVEGLEGSQDKATEAAGDTSGKAQGSSLGGEPYERLVSLLIPQAFAAV